MITRLKAKVRTSIVTPLWLIVVFGIALTGQAQIDTTSSTLDVDWHPTGDIYARIQYSGTLHDLITDTSCANACFYGIEPGASSSSDVETTLTNLNLTYDLESTPGYDISGVYTVDISSMSTSITPIGDVRIFMNSDDTVLIVTFSIPDTPVATIVEQFGPPTRLITPSGFDTWIVYTDLGVVLSTDSNGANPQSISEVELRTPELMRQAFIFGNPYPDSDSCEDYGIFCDVATQTPTPIVTATFTITPITTATDTPAPTEEVTEVVTEEPTDTPTPTEESTEESTPVAGDFEVTAYIDGLDDAQQSIFRYRVTNTGSTVPSGISVRAYFTLDNGEPASDYMMEAFFDSSNALTISGPTQAEGDIYYFTLDYGASAPAPGNFYEFQGVIRLQDYASSFNASNNWWGDASGPSDDLADALTSSDCERACIWGIEPGRSTQADVEATLTSQSIGFSSQSIAASFGLPVDVPSAVDYTLDPAAHYSFISPLDSIQIETLDGDSNFVVYWISIPTTNLSIDDIISVFGNSTWISDVPEVSDPTEYIMVYPSLGALFSVIESNGGYEIDGISLVIPRIVQEVYLNPDQSPSANPCGDDPNLCDLVTATPDSGTTPVISRPIMLHRVAAKGEMAL